MLVPVCGLTVERSPRAWEAAVHVHVIKCYPGLGLDQSLGDIAGAPLLWLRVSPAGKVIFKSG